MLKHKLKSTFALVMVLATLIPSLVMAQVDPSFNPGKLIDDKVFGDMETFGGPEGIQKFLEVKGSVLANTNPDFLVKLKEPQITMLKEKLEDPRPSLGRLRTAAELIWDASRQSGLNPQVLIVTLQKEQSLITGHKDSSPERLQRALDFSLGFGCPDSTGCSQSMYPGFYYQLFGNLDSEGNRYLGAAKSLYKSYSEPQGRGPAIDQQGTVMGDVGQSRIARVGDVVVIPNTQGPPYNAEPRTIVTLLNRATTALYRYTPHVFNGNYNFWKYFNEWFRYPNGTLLKLASGIDTYIIQNGTKQLVPQFVANARSLNLGSTIVVSQNEFESYPSDKVLGPVDNTIVNVIGENRTYVFQKNVKYPASEFVIKQRGLNPANVLNISAAEALLFENGPVLTPSDGTVIRGVQNQAVYLVEGGRLKLFSPYTFSQRKVTPKQIVTVPDDEVATYEKQGFVSPLSGTLVKSQDSGTVYMVENGLKRPITGEIFKNRGLSFKSVAVLSSEEVSALPIGAYATPKDKTFFQTDKTGELYIYKEGAKHSISKFVAKQRGITPDYTFSQSMAGEWQDGIPIPPRDNTVVKGDGNGTVYLVQKGQLRPMTAQAFKNRKLTAKKISVLPQAEVDAYAKGDTLAK